MRHLIDQYQSRRFSRVVTIFFNRSLLSDIANNCNITREQAQLKALHWSLQTETLCHHNRIYRGYSISSVYGENEWSYSRIFIMHVSMSNNNQIADAREVDNSSWNLNGLLLLLISFLKKFEMKARSNKDGPQ